MRCTAEEDGVKAVHEPSSAATHGSASPAGDASAPAGTAVGGQPPDEVDAVRERYARRALAQRDAIDRYSILQPDVWRALQERQRVMLRLFGALGWAHLSDLSVLEVGCGSGGNLLELLHMGFAPDRLCGVELLPDRFRQARARLPAAVSLVQGDAAGLNLPAGRFDMVLQSTVFSSLLDDDYQQRLADAMWDWVKPGGGVLWYDLAFDNPRNRDVRGVPMARVRGLFPHAHIRSWRVTLAPPLARRVARWPAFVPTLLGAVPLLRSHRLAWIGKPGDGAQCPPA